MPANKDFKRVVRARMHKTGESYTAARASLLPSAPPKLAPPAAAPPDYATLAGMSDAAVLTRTGCAWDRWVWALDRVQADSWPHPWIAAHVREKYRLSSWWAQTITVGYERIKGRRAIGQRRNGEYEANKSRTFTLPLARLYRAVSDRRARQRWLPNTDLQVTSSTREKYLRARWPDGSGVQFGFSAKGTGRSMLQIQHGRLPDQAAAARLKAFWAERLEALAQTMAPPARAPRQRTAGGAPGRRPG